jgi:hypothetical protein
MPPKRGIPGRRGVRVPNRYCLQTLCHSTAIRRLTTRRRTCQRAGRRDRGEGYQCGTWSGLGIAAGAHDTGFGAWPAGCDEGDRRGLWIVELSRPNRTIEARNRRFDLLSASALQTAGYFLRVTIRCFRMAARYPRWLLRDRDRSVGRRRRACSGARRTHRLRLWLPGLPAQKMGASDMHAVMTADPRAASAPAGVWCGRWARYGQSPKSLEEGAEGPHKPARAA